MDEEKVSLYIDVLLNSNIDRKAALLMVYDLLRTVYSPNNLDTLRKDDVVAEEPQEFFHPEPAPQVKATPADVRSSYIASLTSRSL